MTTAELERRAWELVNRVGQQFPHMVTAEKTAIVLDVLRSAILASGGSVEDQRVPEPEERKQSNECPVCKGACYSTDRGGDTACQRCGGAGVIEWMEKDEPGWHKRPCSECQPRPRTVSEVLASRRTPAGCCSRHADNMACECLERAASEPEERGTDA